MVIGLIIVTGVVLISGVSVWALLRASTGEIDELEHRLHAPGATTLDYAVPAGVDPAMLRMSLHHGGFSCVVDETPQAEVLRIDCPPGRREDVRRLIAGTPAEHWRRQALTDLYGPVVFADEAHAA